MTDKEQQIRVEIIPRLNRFVDILYDCPYTPFERARLLDKLVVDDSESSHSEPEST